ncbi:MAG: hypothetical protein ACFFC7_00495 [Candidatus Hermodarchaeota archaeon]
MSKGQEFYKKRLESIFAKFVPVNLQITKGKPYLSSDSEKALLNAQKAGELVSKFKFPVLPKTVGCFLQYGVVIKEEILPNAVDYTIIKSKQVMSRRKGSFTIEVTDWDERKIITTLQRTSFKQKIMDDERFYTRFIQPKLADLSKNCSLEISEKITPIIEEFIIFFPIKNNLQENLNAKLTLSTEHFSLIEELKTHQTIKSDLLAKRKQIEDEIKNLKSTKEFENISKVENELRTLKKEKQELMKSKKLKQFLKLVSDLVHRYLRHNERNPQFSGINLYGLDENPLNPEVDWNDTVVTTLVQSLGEYGDIKSLKRSHGSLEKAKERINQNLTNIKTVALFLQARELEKQIMSKETQVSISELLKEIFKKETEFKEINQEIKKLEQRLEEIQEREKELRNKLCEALQNK